MPWVPQTVLDELLAAQRDLRASLAHRSEGSNEGTAAGSSGGGGAVASLRPARPAETDALPPMVRDACEQFAYGDPYERTANTHMAHAMLRAGRSASEIVARLRRGADVPELFV